jgi:hypothetical protein
MRYETRKTWLKTEEPNHRRFDPDVPARQPMGHAIVLQDLVVLANSQRPHEDLLHVDPLAILVRAVVHPGPGPMSRLTHTKA